MAPVPPAKLRLFTPGPLSISDTVKAAMLRDWGSRDEEFIRLVRTVRRQLLAVAEVSEPRHTAVLVQGSGTYGLESVLGSVVPADGRLLVLANGAYGRRLAQIAQALGIRHGLASWPETGAIDADEAAARLMAEQDVTHVAVVHSETTSGVVNPMAAIAAAVTSPGCGLIVDAMSSFGAMPLDLSASGVDFLVSSANKCLQGVPGLAVVIARRAALEACAGRARGLSLDLYEQWRGLEQNGQFRFTPPTHVLAALHQALAELAAEGGVLARAGRYTANHQTLVTGMRAMGFQEYVDPRHQGYVITTFRYPRHPAFRFEAFYALLAGEGFIIYPGKLTREACFRIGTIGQLDPAEAQALLAAIERALGTLGVPVPVP